jgi:HEAT repeat protein
LIVPAIPKIVNLLKDSDKTIRIASVNALSTFSAHGKDSQFIGSTLLMIIIAEFRHLIAPAIPAIVDLLRDNDLDVFWAGADALYQLSKQGVSVNRLS